MQHCKFCAILLFFGIPIPNSNAVYMVGQTTQGDTDRLITDIGNENEVGQGIRDSGVPREEIFITSKLWNTHHPNAKEGLQKTLDALGTDYLDLYVSHHRVVRWC